MAPILFKVDGLHALLSLGLAFVSGLYVRAKLDRDKAVELRAKAERALRELREQPERAEFRIERFELLWYPVVTAALQTMEITNVNPGVPHCAKCAVPLGLEKGEWACARCGGRHPESVADVMVLDAVSKQAIAYFQERRPGYRLSVKGNPSIKPSA